MYKFLFQGRAVSLYQEMHLLLEATGVSFCVLLVWAGSFMLHFASISFLFLPQSHTHTRYTICLSSVFCLFFISAPNPCFKTHTFLQEFMISVLFSEILMNEWVHRVLLLIKSSFSTFFFFLILWRIIFQFCSVFGLLSLCCVLYLLLITGTYKMDMISLLLQENWAQRG